MKTRGEHIAEEVRAYLFTNGLKQSQLTGATLAELADRCLKRLDQIAAKKKRLATEEDWIKEQEADPFLMQAGVNVRLELAAFQFWCKNNTAPATRKRFGVWLAKAARDSLQHGGGNLAKKVNPQAGPHGWLVSLNRLFPDCVYAKGGSLEITTESDYAWGRLPKELQMQIAQQTDAAA